MLNLLYINNYLKESRIINGFTFFIKTFEIGFFINLIKLIPTVRLILTNLNRFFGYTTRDLLYPVIAFFATNSILKLECLADIICADYTGLYERFVVFYSVLSHYFSFRFELVTFSQDLNWISSVTNIFFNAN